MFAQGPKGGKFSPLFSCGLGYLGHILEAIERIDRYTEDMDEVQFLQ